MTIKKNRRTIYILTSLFLVLLLGLAACGSDLSDDTGATAIPPAAENGEGASATGENHEDVSPTAPDDHPREAASGDGQTHEEEEPHDEDMGMHNEGQGMHDDEAPHTEGEGMHSESEEMGHEDMAAAHGVPEEFAEMENSVPATEESIARGRELYQTSCAVCHGETGQGDGVGAAGLDPKPANLSDAHVQGNTDGALFYTISKGVEGTAMVAWEGQIAEIDRWNLVNFVRTIEPAE